MATCAECRTTLKWLRTASSMVATPVPPAPASVRDQALARAGDVFQTQPKTVKAWRQSAEALRAGRSGGAGGGRAGGRPGRSAAGAVAGPPAPVARRSRRPSPVGAVAPTGGLRPAGGGSRPHHRRAPESGSGRVGPVGRAGVGGRGHRGRPGGRERARRERRPGRHRHRGRRSHPGAVDHPLRRRLVGAGRPTARVPDADTSGGVNAGDLGEIPDAATLVARARPVLTQRQAALAAPAAGAAGVPRPASVHRPSRPRRSAPVPARWRPGPPAPAWARSSTSPPGRWTGVPVVVLGFEPGLPPADVTLLALAQQEGCRVVLEAAGP